MNVSYLITHFFSTHLGFQLLNSSFRDKTFFMKRLFTILTLLIAIIQVNATVITINVSNYVFTPNAVTASCTDTIRFHRVNGTHPVVSETAAWVTFTMNGALVNKDIVLPTAGTYAYYCDFHGGAGGVGMSGTITITCAPPTCDVPTGVTASNITATSAKISWVAVAGATKYQIQYRQVGAMGWSKANSTTTSKNIPGLLPATSYQYKVKTICGALSSAFSITQTFTTLTMKGETPPAEITEEHVTQMGVYPNPSNGDFQLVMEHVHQDDIVVQIFDLTGKLIFEKEIIVQDMDVIENISLPDGFAGNAIVKVEVAGKIYTKDILVQ